MCLFCISGILFAACDFVLFYIYFFSLSHILLLCSFIHDFIFISFFRYVFVIHPLDHSQLTNGYDHYAPAEASYSAGVAFPFTPNPSSSSHSSSSPSSSYSSSTLRSWSRPGSALMPDYPHYSTLTPGMLPPSSKIPSWKVCPSVLFTPLLH